MLGSLGHLAVALALLAVAFALRAVGASSGQYSGHLACDHRNDSLADPAAQASFSTKTIDDSI